MKSYRFKRAIAAALIAGQLFYATPAFSSKGPAPREDIWKEIKRIKDNYKPGELMVAQKTKETDMQAQREAISEEIRNLVERAYSTGYKGLEEDRKYIESEMKYGGKPIKRIEWLKKYGIKYLSEEQKGYLKNNKDNYLGQRLLYTYANILMDIEKNVETPENFLNVAKKLVEDAKERIPKQVKEAVPVRELPQFEYGHVPSPPQKTEMKEEQEDVLAKRSTQGQKDAEKIVALLKGERENKPYTYYIGDYWVQYFDSKITQVRDTAQNLSGKEREAYRDGFLKGIGFKGEFTDENFFKVTGELGGIVGNVRVIRAEMFGYSEILKRITEISGYSEDLARREKALREKIDGLGKFSEYGNSIKNRLMAGYSYMGESGDYLTNITNIAKSKDFTRKKDELYNNFVSWLPTDKNLKNQYNGLDGSIVWSTFNTLDLRTQKAILDISIRIRPSSDKLAALIIGAKSMPDNYAPLFIENYGERILRDFNAGDIPKIVTYIGGYMTLFSNARDLDGLNRYVGEINSKLSGILMWNIYRVWERTRQTQKTAIISPVGGEEYVDLANPAAQIAINRYLTLFEDQNMLNILEKLNSVNGSTFDERVVLAIQKYPDLFVGPMALIQNFEQAYLKTMGPIVRMNVNEPNMDISVINFDLDLYALAPNEVPKLGDLDIWMLGVEGTGNMYNTYSGETGIKDKHYRVTGKGGTYGPGMKAEVKEATYEVGSVETKMGKISPDTYEVQQEKTDRFTFESSFENIPGEGVIKNGRLYLNKEEKSISKTTVGDKGLVSEETPLLAQQLVAASFEHLAPGGAVTAMVFDFSSLEANKEKYRAMNAELFRKVEDKWIYAGSIEITPKQVEQLYGVWHQQWDKAKNISSRQEGAAVLFFNNDLFGENKGEFQGVGAAVEYGKSGFGGRYEHKLVGPDKGVAVVSHQPDKNKIWAGLVYVNPEFVENYNTNILFKTPVGAQTTSTGEPVLQKESIGVRPQLSKEGVIGKKAEKGAAVELMFAESDTYYSDAFISTTSETVRLGIMSKAVKPWGYFGVGGTGIAAKYGEREDIMPGGIGSAYYATNDKMFLTLASVAAQAYEKYTGVTQAAGMRYFFELFGGINNIKIVDVYQKGVDEKNGVFCGAEVRRDKAGNIRQIRLYYLNGTEWKKAQDTLSLNLFGGGSKVGMFQWEATGAFAETGQTTGQPLTGPGGSAKLWFWELTDKEGFKISPALQVTAMGDILSFGFTSLLEIKNLRLQVVPISYYQQTGIKGNKKSGTFESSFVGRYYLLGGFLDFGAGWLTQVSEETKLNSGEPKIKKGDKATEVALLIGGGEILASGYFDEWSVYGGFVYWVTPYQEKNQIKIDINLKRYTAPGMELKAFFNFDADKILFTGAESLNFSAGIRFIYYF